MRDLEEDYSKGLFNIPCSVMEKIDSPSLETVKNWKHTKPLREWVEDFHKETSPVADLAEEDVQNIKDIESKKVLSVFQKSMSKIHTSWAKQLR